MITNPAGLRVRRIWALTVMFCVAAAVLTADAISKAQVLDRLPGHPPVSVLHGLVTLDLTFNAGAAFGVGPSYTAVIALVVCGVIVSIIRTARRLRSMGWTIALGLLLGGAMGNLGDRLFRAPGLLRGRVVDWINLPHFPWTFNLADASITCAAVLIAVLALRGIRIDGTSPGRTPPTGSTEPRRPAPPTVPGELTLGTSSSRAGRAQLGDRTHAEQLHGPQELFGQDVERLVDPGLAARHQAVQVGASDGAGVRAERQRHGDIRTVPDAGVDQHGHLSDPTASRTQAIMSADGTVRSSWRPPWLEAAGRPLPADRLPGASAGRAGP